MSNLDSTQSLNDKIQPPIGSDQGPNTPMVDMANPSQVQGAFKPQESQGSVVSQSRQVTFSNPYESGPGNWKENNWRDGAWGGDHDSDRWSQQDSLWQNGDTAAGATGQTDSTAPYISTPASGTDSTGTPASAGNLEQQLEAQIAQLQAQLVQMSAEVSQYLGSGSSTQTSGGDSTASTPSTPVTANGSDSASNTTTPPASNGGSTGGSTGGEGTISQPSTVAPPPADTLLATMQTTDPIMAQTLTDASTNMSAQGYSQLEQYIGANYTTNGNDAQLLSGALTQAGLSTADDTALTSVLQTDMPSALQASGATTNAGSDSSGSTGTATANGGTPADNTSQPATINSTAPSDPFLAQMQGSDQAMAQTLTDASSQLSAGGYSQLEQYLSTNYTNSGNDSQLMSQALTQAGLSSADNTALTNVLQTDMPAALTAPSTGTPTDNSSSSGSTGSTGSTGTAGDATTPTTTPNTNTTAPTTGNYNVINGKIIGPNGQPFDAIGVGVYASQAQSEAAAIMQQMPNLNFIRLAATPAQDSPAQVQAAIQAFQSINPNVVVEVEDHTSGGTDGTTNNTLSGQALANEENWYSQVASANVNNANVWFGTANEPNNPFNEQDVVTQEQGIYNAIRSTGNNNMIMLEADGGGSFGPQQADASAYSGMTNVAWDIHYYGWVTNGDTSVANNVTAVQNEMAGAAGITESNGAGGQQNIPVIVGEYGDSTNGTTVDSNGAAAVDAVQTANNQGLVQGAVAWVWNGNNEPNNSDAITQDGTASTMTPYGQEIVNYVNNGSTGPVT